MSLRPSSYEPDRRKIERGRKIRGLAVNRLRDKSAFGRTLPHSNARDRQQQETTAFEDLARLWAAFYLSLSMGPVD